MPRARPRRARGRMTCAQRLVASLLLGCSSLLCSSSSAAAAAAGTRPPAFSPQSSSRKLLQAGASWDDQEPQIMPLPINVAFTSDAGIAVTTGPFDDTTSSWTVTPEGTARGRIGAIGDELATWGFDPQVGAGVSLGPAGKYAVVEVGPTGHMVTLGDGAVIAGAGDNGWSFALGRGDVVGMRVTPTEGVYFELGGGMFNLLLRPDGHVEMLPLRTAGTAAGGSAASASALAGLREGAPASAVEAAAAGGGGRGGSSSPLAAARRAARDAPAVIPAGDASKATRLPGRVVGGRVGAPAASTMAPRPANANKEAVAAAAAALAANGGGAGGSNLRSGNGLVDALYSGNPDKAQLQARLDRVGAVLKGIVGMAAGGAAKAAMAAQGLPAGGGQASLAAGGPLAAFARRGGGPVFLPAPSGSASRVGAGRGGAGGGSSSSSGLRVPAQGAEAAAAAAAAVAAAPAAQPAAAAPAAQPAACPEGSVARVSAATGRTVCRTRRAQQQQQQGGGGGQRWERQQQHRRWRDEQQLQQGDYDAPGRWRGGQDYDYDPAPAARGRQRREQQRQQHQWRADYDDEQQPQAPPPPARRRTTTGAGSAAAAEPDGSGARQQQQQQQPQQPQYETVSYYGGR